MAVARWLETDTNTNKDISSAVSIGAYTADADRMIVCDVSLDAVAGNGDYVIYVTRQINGAGSAYVLLPKTTCTAASGETAIAMQSGPITVRSGDVLTVYLDGLAGDTTTPDTTVRWFEMAALRPATADRTLDILATGEASANVTYWAGVAVVAADADGMIKVDAEKWTGLWLDEFSPGVTAFMDEGNTITSQRIRDAMMLAPTAGDPAAGSVDAHLDALALETTAQAILEDTGTTLPALISAGNAGSGATSYTITVQDEDSNPIDGVEVWITTDAAGLNVIAGTLTTDAMGLAIFMLDAGDYYVWRQRSGYNFTNPVAITVS